MQHHRDLRRGAGCVAGRAFVSGGGGGWHKASVVRLFAFGGAY